LPFIRSTRCGHPPPDPCPLPHSSDPVGLAFLSVACRASACFRNGSLLLFASAAVPFPAAVKPGRPVVKGARQRLLLGYVRCIARSGVPHAAKCARHSLVHFVIEN
jgi:hypothetical protein